MGFLGDALQVVGNAGERISNFVQGGIDDIKNWGQGLINEVGATISSEFGDDVIGINAEHVGDMIQAIEDYITKVNGHLDEVKQNTETKNAMKGEYAAAVKAYVGVACDVCKKITSRLKYFEDKLVKVREAYLQKDTNLTSSINDTATEMDSQWEEYKRQYEL